MEGQWRGSLLVLVAVLVVSSSARIKTADEVDKDQETVTALSTFSVRLAREILREKPGNIVISPLGVATLLAELLQGVGKASATSLELQDALGRTVNEARSIGQVGADIKDVNSKTTDVLIGSKMFLAEGKNVTERFDTILKRYFNETVSHVPFTNAYLAADQINSWAARSTKGKVPAIVNPASLSPDTRLVLANAAYFKGVWESAFTANQTESRWFYTGERDPPTPVWMMHQIATLPGGQDASSGAWWVRMPVNEKHAVLFVLPNRRYGLDDVIARLTAKNIFEMARNPLKRTVDFYLPRFAVGSSSSLMAPLKRMGVQGIFNKDSSLTAILNAYEPVVVSEVLQRARMEVDEKGVTAAAVSVAVVNTLTLASYTDDIRLVFDQPFLAILVDQLTGLPIFISRVVNPTGGETAY